MKGLLRSLAGILGVLLYTALPAVGDDLKADFDGSGVVDLDDFFLFLGHYGQAAGQPGFDVRFDIIGDGTVNQADFFVFSQNFGARAAGPQPGESRRTYLYVADYPANGLSIVNIATNLVLTYLPFRGPSGIAVSSDQRTTYVVDLYAFLVLREDFNVDYTLPVRAGARVALSPDNQVAYVTEEAANTVLFIDLARKSVSDTVTVGPAPFGVTVSLDGRTLYVVNTGVSGGRLAFVDVPSKSVRDSLSLTTGPGMMAVSPDGKRGFLNSATSGTIQVVDLAARRLVGGIQTGGGSVYGLAFSPDGRRLYATATGRVLVIDAERNLIVDRIALTDETGPLAVSPDGARLYVSGYSQTGGGAGVYILDLATRQTLGKIRGFAFPSDLAIRTSSVDVPPARRNRPAILPDTTESKVRPSAWRPGTAPAP